MGKTLGAFAGAWLGLGLLASAGSAATLDGSSPIVCAMTSIYECWDGDCDEYPKGGAIAPFYQVDVGQSRVTATDGSGRVSPILRVERLADRLLLQGGESGRAWSVLIVQTGRLTGNILTEDGSFSLFGACMAP